MGNNSNLKYGARLLNSFMGDNSTVSCCEMLNNLIFPAHEQHHNNSFLVAALLMGQSNLAAGATIGSNHNSRANDNEIQAGRGFWPGLCTSIKHSCRFASFILLAKADYPAEMDIPLPFSLLNNNTSKDHLEVMPAFWWTYNMYALARNTWKFQTRDKRVTKVQNIEFDSLAPDTVEEIFTARHLLEIWVAKAYLRKNDQNTHEKDDSELAQIGRDLLQNSPDIVDTLEVLGENMEKTKRNTVILQPYKAYHAYGQMIIYYAVKNLIEYMDQYPDAHFNQMAKSLECKRNTEWSNLGGQLVPTDLLDKIRADITAGKLNSWEDIHNRYDQLFKDYTFQKQQHCYASLCDFLGKTKLSCEDWIDSLKNAVEIQQYVCDQVYISRKKDFDNPYRQATYRNIDEMTAAIGTIEGNSFVLQVRKETENFKNIVEDLIKRG
jgi:hypothetical protein